MIETIHAHLEKVAKHLGIPPEALEKLKKADREHIFEIEMDNGRTYRAYRVQHSNKRGPYKGGIRYHKNVNLDEIRSLATLMSLKTAAINIPMGGGKGGVAIDPRELSSKDLEEISRKYVQRMHKHIGPHKDIPAPDVNTNAQIIDWMVDEYEKLTDDSSKASFTGKSLGNKGSLGRDAATGRGGVLALHELLALDEHDQNHITFAIQGFGNVGSYFGTIAEDQHKGWKLLAASDSEAAVYSPQGLQASKLRAFKADRGRFKDYKDEQTIANAELLSLDVDVLVLAGLENSITDQNMKHIRADYIIEMANGPITKEAYEYLNHKGKVILPGIIANAGGVLVSYLEWLQNTGGEKWTEDKVNHELAQHMVTAIKETYEYAKANNLSLNEASYSLAIKRLLDA